MFEFKLFRRAISEIQTFVCIFTVIKNLGNVSMPGTENFAHQSTNKGLSFILSISLPHAFLCSFPPILSIFHSLFSSLTLWGQAAGEDSGVRAEWQNLFWKNQCALRGLWRVRPLYVFQCLILSRSLSSRLCLPVRRLPAPLELMLCSMQHGQDNDRILRAYIFCNRNYSPFLFCLLCVNGLFLFSNYTLLSSSPHFTNWLFL